MKEIELHVRIESRPGTDATWRPGTDATWGCLLVNSHHIWRFESVGAARLAAVNLKKALRSSGLEVRNEITEDKVK